MRYNIVNNQVVESFWIDATYDTKEDALEALKDIISNSKCPYCNSVNVVNADECQTCIAEIKDRDHLYEQDMSYETVDSNFETE